MRALIRDKICRIAGPRLAEISFAYQGKPYPNTWQFTRRVGDVDQFITFQKSYLEPNSLRVNLSTSQDRMGVELRVILDGTEGSSWRGWWTYHDDESLDSTLCELAELTVRFGIPWLDHSGGPFLEAPEQFAKELLINPKERARQFADRYALGLADLSCLATVDRIVLRRYGEVDGRHDWDFLLGAGAFLGEFYRRELGGEWGWDPQMKTPAIIGVGGNPAARAHPFSAVIGLWSKRDRVRSLLLGFEGLRNLLSPPETGRLCH